MQPRPAVLCGGGGIQPCALYIGDEGEVVQHPQKRARESRSSPYNYRKPVKVVIPVLGQQVFFDLGREGSHQ